MLLLRSAVAALLILSTAPASAMTVAAFLDKANALKRKGPLALFSSDLKLLAEHIKGDGAALRAENTALEKAGKRKHYCTPPDFRMDEDGVMAAMESVPPPQRAQLTTRAALRAYLGRRHPCPR